MNLRRKAREMAVQILYRIDVAEEGIGAGKGSAVDDIFFEGGFPGFAAWAGGAKDYAGALVRGVLDKKGEIDSAIEASSENWSIERMPVVDRNIMRIAVYEMRYSDIPFKVAIDEAVELAKRFGTEESGAFVNGILDRVHREAGEKRPASTLS